MPTVSFDGDRYLVTYMREFPSTSRTEIWGKFLAADGSMINDYNHPGFAIESGCGSNSAPQTTFDGLHHMVTWNYDCEGGRIKSKWISTTGAVLDREPVTVMTPSIGLYNPDVIRGVDGDYIVVVDQGAGTSHAQFVHDHFQTMTAEHDGDGNVALEWGANPDIDNVEGVNVYRSAALNDDYVQLNLSPLPATGAYLDNDPYQVVSNYYSFELLYEEADPAWIYWSNTSDLSGIKNVGELIQFESRVWDWVDTPDLVGAEAARLARAEDGTLYVGITKYMSSGWSQMGDLTGATSVVDLFEASDGAIYAGTYPRGDVFKSLDGGETWANTGDLSGCVLPSKIDEDSSGAVYTHDNSGGDRQVYKTTNGGTSWSQIFGPGGERSITQIVVTDDDTLYAGSYNGQPLGATIFRSTDGGASWTDMTDFSQYATAVNSFLAVSTGTILAGTRDRGEIFRTTDGWNTWTKYGISQGEYVDDLMEAADGTLYAATSRSYQTNGDVFKSTNDGVSWSNTGDLSGADRVFDLAQTPDGAIWAGARTTSDVATLYRSTNGGSSWSVMNSWTESDHIDSLLVTSGGDVLVGLGNGNVYRYVPDPSVNGEVFKSTNDGESWESTEDIPGALRVFSVFVHSSGNVYVGTYPNGDVFVSSDGGASWNTTGDLADAEFVYALYETTDGTMYAGTYPNGDVFKSLDDGATWANTGELIDAERVYALLETRSGALLAGTFPDAVVFRSTDSGASWSLVTEFVGPTAVRDLLQMQDDAIYAATTPGDGAVYKSTDDGLTWSVTGSFSPDTTGTKKLAEGPDGSVYAATGGGTGMVYRSADGGGSWIEVGDPDVGAVELESLVVAEDGRIFTSTYPEGGRDPLPADPLALRRHGLRRDRSGRRCEPLQRVQDLGRGRHVDLYGASVHQRQRFHPGPSDPSGSRRRAVRRWLPLPQGRPPRVAQRRRRRELEPWRGAV